MEKNEKYEQLMRWIMKDIPKNKNLRYDIGWNLMHLDIFNVINTNDEMLEFIKDLEDRLGQPGRFLVRKK